MKVLIIFAHPKAEKSFNHAILEVVEKELKNKKY